MYHATTNSYSLTQTLTPHASYPYAQGLDDLLKFKIQISHGYF